MSRRIQVFLVCLAILVIRFCKSRALARRVLNCDPVVRSNTRSQTGAQRPDLTVIGFEAMPPDPVHTVTLTCHPETPTEAVRGIAARVSRTPGKLSVSYVLDGDLKRLRVPAPRAPRIVGRLWEHTCCEIFIACKGLPAYHEFNLSPSGEWAEYAFEGYRKPRVGESCAVGPPPQVAVRGAAGRLELDAVIRLDRLSALHSSAPLSLALSAVVEDSDGALSYWALRHPPGTPDFHHSEAFALELAKVG